MAGITRPMSQMRKMEAKETLFRTRKRILNYLVLAFLKQEGFFHSAETFVREANLTGEYEICDNIDLDIILQDFCNYYLIRFNKQPQLCRKVQQTTAPIPPRPQTRRAERRKPSEEPAEKLECEKPHADLPSSITISSLDEVYLKPSPTVIDSKPILKDSTPSVLTKPLSGLMRCASQEKRELIEMLYQDIIRPSGVSWDDIKGLTEAKSLLMESVIYPVRYPEVFTGLLEPWRGILLHGPPGTGKTLLARAVAAESGCTFFNVACSTVITKWRGDSEKIVKVLFEMATYYSPSVIFIDELESIASDRSVPGEHEASRRLKTQLLTELDGFNEREGIVFLLANSNMPWDIDAAMLRRLEKRIHIPLPDFKTRTELFERFLSSKNIELYPKVDFQELASKTEGYSGSDIKLVCKEALMTTVRKILPSMNSKGNLLNRKDRLNVSEILTAIEKTKPVSKHLAFRHVKWQNEMGCS
ncbi:katanin p60 ATPase-containing subunit A-like 2 [Hyposmocoma kahamanoa]|uniref:katanin p60 ATPase-containing subunit A-like 2 n=1 Tax=Hyposmocoma kahamanoa TaxID=1477025 RepID=UPI000E6D5F18|nr:katanin p60 ATPase-containing subunit A-like 2 [Hyposmocoma kahamanoa]